MAAMGRVKKLQTHNSKIMPGKAIKKMRPQRVDRTGIDHIQFGFSASGAFCAVCAICLVGAAFRLDCCACHLFRSSRSLIAATCKGP